MWIWVTFREIHCGGEVETRKSTVKNSQRNFPLFSSVAVSPLVKGKILSMKHLFRLKRSFSLKRIFSLAIEIYYRINLKRIFPLPMGETTTELNKEKLLFRLRSVFESL